MDEERGAFARRAYDGNRAAVLLDDPICDGQAQSRPFPDLLSGEEGIKDPPLDRRGNPLSSVGERDLHALGAERSRNANCFTWRLGHCVARIRQQVDENLLELNWISNNYGFLRAQVDRDPDLTQPELLLHERQRPLDHLPKGDRLVAYGS